MDLNKWPVMPMTLPLLCMSPSSLFPVSLHHLHKLKENEGQVEPQLWTMFLTPCTSGHGHSPFQSNCLCYVCHWLICLCHPLSPVATQPSLELPGINPNKVFSIQTELLLGFYIFFWGKTTWKVYFRKLTGWNFRARSIQQTTKIPYSETIKF